MSSASGAAKQSFVISKLLHLPGYHVFHSFFVVTQCLITSAVICCTSTASVGLCTWSWTFVSSSPLYCFYADFKTFTGSPSPTETTVLKRLESRIWIYHEACDAWAVWHKVLRLLSLLQSVTAVSIVPKYCVVTGDINRGTCARASVLPRAVFNDIVGETRPRDLSIRRSH